MSVIAATRLILRGESLLLLPERALYWEDRRTLLVADAHWGKAATFRAGGIPVPGGTTAEGLHRLTLAIGRTGAERIVFLGDFLHARAGRARATLMTLGSWREHHARVDLLLIRGNHDREAGDPPEELEITCVDPPRREGPFLLTHHPTTGPEVYGIAGHVHPVVRLTGPARERQRLPCFWFGRYGTVLPAFGAFTGGADISPAPGDRVFVVAGDAVIEIAR
ncbi:MAG TPA: ligase-associated DNA damage response endonuclease PdeM [Longimicrobiaceae bacterium]|nr:ligase-associated DNA damage response endonuclease PdeM [Longimicrobiaceae bacterium]